MAGPAEQTPAAAGQMRHLSLGNVALNFQAWDAIRKNPDHDSLGGSRTMGSDPTGLSMGRAPERMMKSLWLTQPCRRRSEASEARVHGQPVLGGIQLVLWRER